MKRAVFFMILGVFFSTVHAQATMVVDKSALSKDMYYEVRDLDKEVLIMKLSQKIDRHQVDVTEQVNTAMEENSGILEEAMSGVEMGVGMTGILQSGSNINIPEADGDTSTTDASYSVDIEFSAGIGENGTAAIILEAGQGDGITDELDVFANANADATGDAAQLSIIEAWYEHAFQGMIFTGGYIDATAWIDGNTYAEDETTQFLADMFTGSAAAEFPDNGPGVHLGAEASENISWDVVAMDGDGDFEDVFAQSFIAAQVNINPKLVDRDGNYRFYVWQNNTDHALWSDPSRDMESGSGVGISFDQELGDGVGAFVRYGVQDEDVYTVHTAFSAGLQINGFREGDNIGLAYGVITPSDEYRRTQDVKAGDEEHIEIYYRYVLNDNVAITPSLIFIKNPLGGDAEGGSDTITVASVRT